MKKQIALCLLTAGMLIGVTVYGSVASDNYVESAQVKVLQENTVVTNTDTASVTSLHAETILKECINLIGKSDAESAEMLGGGEENIAGDGTTKIGRIYHVELFGETIEVGTLYDENERVMDVIMQLEKGDVDTYANELISLYGEPMSSDDELSEGGATWKTWNVQDATIQLYQQSGLVSLEITQNYSEDNAHSFDTDQLYTGWLPKGVNQVMAETEPNKALEKAIIEYYEIPDDQLSTTKYYYNYVDLNGDGTDEIMAVIVGPYTSGTGGDSAIWGREFEGEFQLYQAFTLVNTPIIVTKDAVNGREFGSKRLILQRRGVSERETVELVANDGVYTNVADAETFEGLDQVEGTAIICNNMIKDLESKNYLTLGN
ncbi:MAG: hypothetical protein KIC67_09660 [Clostridium butyricum]|nr:hypothetical protein [Clostridium butyricum]